MVNSSFFFLLDVNFLKITTMIPTAILPNFEESALCTFFKVRQLLHHHRILLSSVLFRCIDISLVWVIHSLFLCLSEGYNFDTLPLFLSLSSLPGTAQCQRQEKQAPPIWNRGRHQIYSFGKIKEKLASHEAIPVSLSFRGV